MPYQLLSRFKIPLILIGLAFLSFLLTNYNSQPHFQEFLTISKNLFEDKAKIKQERADKVYSILNTNLVSADSNYAVFVKDLKSGEVFSILPDELMAAASIYKLAVMYKTFDAIQSGQISKDDVLSAPQSKLDSQLSDVPVGQDNQNPQIAHTVGEALSLMITISDNYSALLLAQKLGWSNIERFLENQGVNNFTLASDDLPTATATSTAQILEKIYRGEAVSKQASNEMEKLLLNQQVNDRIPKYLPNNVNIAHKTGELDNVRNDAAIVFGKKSDYIFVFFSDTQNPDEGSEKIANVAKNIFDVLEN